MSNSFTAAYARLNPRQKEAVDAIEGPVMVVAGPGTGKTQILTLRVANILLKTDTPPDAILALTFTESGVYSMRRRLVDIIGSSAYQVGIFTFHGFCNDVIRRFPDAFPRIIGSEHLADIEKLSILRDCISALPLSKLKPFGNNFFFLDPVRGKIGELKRENISPEDLRALIQQAKADFEAIDDKYYESGRWEGKMKGKYQDIEKQIQKNEELLAIYERYETELRFRKRFDYEDMIMEVVRTLKRDEDLLLRLQEDYHYILADEHQDANASQNTLLELLSSFHEHPNLFIVGDEKQAIFRFQGASLENFLYFKKRFPEAFLITLEDAYRSSQHILDAAHSLMPEAENPLVPRVALASKAGASEQPIEVRAFSNSEYERLYLAEDVKQKIAEGVESSEIAVLYRTNRDAEAVIEALDRADIPFVVESDQNVLSDPDIRKLISLLRAAHRLGDDAALVEALYLDFFDIAPGDIYRVLRAARGTRRAVEHVLTDEKALKEAGVEHTGPLLRAHKIIQAIAVEGRNEDLMTTVFHAINESGYLESIVARPEAGERLAALNGLIDEVRTLVSAHREWRLPQLMEYFELLEEHNILVKRESRLIKPKGVRLMTAHRSKGLEFDYVYMVKVADGHWGNRREMEHFKIPAPGLAGRGGNDDERRLFYVALTRARHGVFISYAEVGESGKQQLPSLFLEELDKEKMRTVSTDEFEAGISPEVSLKREARSHQPGASDKAYLNALFVEQGLSATALNNFFASPWLYFFNNLLRVPSVQSKDQLFGIAVHAALKDLFDAKKQGKTLSEKRLIERFERALKEQPLSEAAYAESLARGREYLAGWYQTYKKTWVREIYGNELSITAELPLGLPELPAIKLRGVLDKVEYLDGSHLIVTDYKTGAPKSPNAIKGLTKSDDGGYYRQLIFYKLLLSLYKEGELIMDEGVIDFVQPDQNGKYRQESFPITDAEVENLKEEIRTAARSILDLSFWDEPCEVGNRRDMVRWCRLHQAMMGRE